MRTRFAAIAVSAACGSGSPATVDGALIDAAPADAAQSGGAPTPSSVAVFVAALGSPVTGATAYFQNADGTLVKKVATDEQGIAWAELAAGGYATVLARPLDENTPVLSTFTDVQPGDRLHVDRAPAPLATLAINLALPALPDEHTYMLYTSCGDVQTLSSASAVIGLAPCGAAIDLVAVTIDREAQVDGAVFAPAQHLNDGSVVDLRSAPIQPLATATLAFAHVPAPFVGASETLLTPRGRSYSASVGVAVSSGTAGASLAMPPMTADAVALAVTTEYPLAGDIGAQTVYQWPAGASYALDGGALRLQPFATAPTANPRQLAWSEGIAPLAANVTRASLTVDRPGIPSDTTVRWQIAAAHTGSTLALPALPDDLGPREGDTLAIVELTTAAVPGGYAAIRANAFAELANAIDATTPGTLVIQTLAPSTL